MCPPSTVRSSARQPFTDDAQDRTPRTNPVEVDTNVTDMGLKVPAATMGGAAVGGGATVEEGSGDGVAAGDGDDSASGVGVCVPALCGDDEHALSAMTASAARKAATAVAR